MGLICYLIKWDDQMVINKLDVVRSLLYFYFKKLGCIYLGTWYPGMWWQGALKTPWRVRVLIPLLTPSFLTANMTTNILILGYASLLSKKNYSFMFLKFSSFISGQSSWKVALQWSYRIANHISVHWAVAQ